MRIKPKYWKGRSNPKYWN